MKRVLSSGAGLLLIALAFLAFNMVSGLLFSGARLDLTEQKLYTISPGTKRILAGLDEPINLYFFYSDSGARELVPLRNYARRVEELLRAYEREANGRIRLQVIDPEPFSENEDKATEFGLQGVPLQQGGDNLYFGLAGSNALDGVQVIPFFPLDQEEFLEYDISRLVQTLAQPQRPVVGLMSSLPLNGGFDMASRQPTSPWMVMEEIRQQFDLRSLKSDATEIPPEVSVLLLVHPKQLPEQTLYAIDQFVLRGGKLLAFVDPFSEADSGSDFAATLDGDKSSDLAPLFEAWGLRLLPGKVLGDGAYAMSISLGRDQRPARHPAWLSLPREALDQDDIATAGLESLTLATPGILERLPGASTSFTPLLQSSTQAMPFDASRFGLLRDPGDLMREAAPERPTAYSRRPYPGAGEECLRGGHRGASGRPEGGAQHQCHRRGRYRPAQRSHVGPGAGLLRPARAAALGRQRRAGGQRAGQPVGHRRADQRALPRPVQPAVRGGRAPAARGRDELPAKGGPGSSSASPIPSSNSPPSSRAPPRRRPSN